MNNKANCVDRHIAARLRRLRQSLGIKLDELDRALGLANGVAAKLESGGRSFNIAELYDISQFLGADIGYFFEGLPETKKSGVSDAKDHGQVLKLYAGIADDRVRLSIFGLIKEIAKSGGGQMTEKAPSQRRALLARVESIAGASGLTCLGAFHPQPADGLPFAAGTLVLVGSAGPGMWDVFSSKRRQGPNPLDAWTRRVLTSAAKQLGARVLFPFDQPHLPFASLAIRAKIANLSPLGILIHHRFGLWHAYRGLLAFDNKWDLPPVEERPNPCLSCPEKPCLNACPVKAFKSFEYDGAHCRSYLATNAGQECLSSGCISRNACPKGAEYRYGPEQTRFHMQAFANGQQPVC